MTSGNHPLARLEAICASAVERAFAIAFPSELEPVQVARKLVAIFESTTTGSERGGRRFVVQLSPSDYARLANERTYLVGQWNAMLARLADRSGRPQSAPDVCVAELPGIAIGTVSIAVESLPEPSRLAVAMRRGLPRDARVSLTGTAIIGRDAACEFVIDGDPRVSRKHLALDATNGVRFRDLSSSNGTFVNGVKRDEGELHVGDVLRVGDTELAIVADDDAATTP